MLSKEHVIFKKLFSGKHAGDRGDIRRDMHCTSRGFAPGILSSTARVGSCKEITAVQQRPWLVEYSYPKVGGSGMSRSTQQSLSVSRKGECDVEYLRWTGISSKLTSLPTH